MDYVLGYDCDGNEIYEYRILCAIWSSNIDIKELADEDPRQYCAVVGDDGKAYAISVYDWWHSDLIRKRENIADNEEIPTIIKPISEMENYELAACANDEFYYDLDREGLKQKLNRILKKETTKKLIKKII